MKIYKFQDYKEVSKKASSIIIDAIKENSHLRLGLATGDSPKLTYKYLIDAYLRKEISFKNITTFNLDEYIGISPNHPQSYHYFMYEHLFNYIDILKENINLPKNSKDNIKEEIEEYDLNILQNQVDLQILGIGQNGHIGFNEPGSSFDNKTFVVDLDEQTRIDNSRFFDSIDDVPTQAITLGIKNIMRSKKIILIATGHSKAEAVHKMIYGKITEQLPASILQLHPDVTIILDKEAAKFLPSNYDYFLI